MPNPLQSFAEIKAPPRNKLMGLVADALTRANEFATMQDPRYADKRQNQTLGILADALSLGSIAKTADRLSYGDALTNAKKANVPFLKPETADAAMMAPLSPRTALAALGMGMGDNALTRAATVWHGSPHKFDKFDSSKIGTGEGAQAYGHGLYFADSQGVAASYRDMWANRSIPDEVANKSEFHKMIADKMRKGDSLTTAYDRSMDRFARGRPKEAQALTNAMNEIAALQPENSLYKVDLPDEKIARMLDWDKPLSQQAPEVRKAVESVMEKRAAEAEAQRLSMNAQYPNRTTHPVLGKIANKPRTAFDYKGEAAVSSLVQELGGPDKAASFLRAQGIPGIKYLDGGSRGNGAGTSNYVVFAGEEEALKILERNGIRLD